MRLYEKVLRKPGDEIRESAGARRGELPGSTDGAGYTLPAARLPTDGFFMALMRRHKP